MYVYMYSVRVVLINSVQKISLIVQKFCSVVYIYEWKPHLRDYQDRQQEGSKDEP